HKWSSHGERHELHLESPQHGADPTSTFMRSHRVSKLVLASLVGIVIVWSESTHSDDVAYLLQEGLGVGR
ncbi:hypothetical protein AVEN_130807-1, partial [Araneus ventricosus]